MLNTVMSGVVTIALAVSIAASAGVIVVERRIFHNFDRIGMRPGGRERCLKALRDAIAGKSREIPSYLPEHEAHDVIEFCKLSNVNRKLKKMAIISLLIAIACALVRALP
jgi:hypothetical protein